jgi:hypothetical protein
MSQTAIVGPVDGAPAVGSSPSAPPDPMHWATSLEVLRDLLNKEGCVSSLALREALERRGIPDARDMVIRLRYFDFDAPDDVQFPKPDFRWHGHARSFYSPERYQTLQKAEEVKATVAENEEVAAAATDSEEAEEEVYAAARARPKYRQEERRLGAYAVSTLESLYQSEHTPEDSDYVFDVHSDRPGTEFENVDLLAVHWRSSKTVELIAVEVKLDFTARLVQQARNYSRFADRVWIAVPVLAELSEAANALRDFDPMLFEHVVDSGLGILACRRRPGRSYEVVPVHWPRRIDPDPVEKELFLERYRKHFEAAGVLPPRGGRRYPSLA